jgi:hypothetical protein
MATFAACASFLDDLLHNLKDKQTELNRDEESFGNSPSENDLGYLVEKYKASLDYFIQDVQAAVDRMPNAPAGNANNENPSNQVNSNVNNITNNPRGGKRKNKKTRRHRK